MFMIGCLRVNGALRASVSVVGGTNLVLAETRERPVSSGARKKQLPEM
jgi:hypothetical protein